jgi:hypothetical protein
MTPTILSVLIFGAATLFVVRVRYRLFVQGLHSSFRERGRQRPRRQFQSFVVSYFDRPPNSTSSLIDRLWVELVEPEVCFLVNKHRYDPKVSY